MKYLHLLPLLSLILIASAAHAADDMAGMVMNAPASDAQNDIYAPAMMKMHQTMSATKPTGNPDIDFVQGMIPHHQAAIDMAKIELQQGKDLATRKLAQQIIRAQHVEIKQMNAWLAAHKK